MLDTDTRRRIDAARDILVGKVPDPKSQVEQITIALIYKFMDDMDAQSEEMGGRRSFFAGEFERFRWANLVQPGIGGHETLDRYVEAITRMPENPGVPPLFRSIFRNAYLPYRDPETLRAFLKEIDRFSYDDSERLGDAFESLLSVLGAQGDAGQFRTPRHIIDFIVAVLDPKKDERVLDPACGTAGFLISVYKHILAANTDEQGAGSLTPDDYNRLAGNFTGYDISPDMVRLSLVNMYLHGFKSPDIKEYDTLTSEEYWDRHADVILANPPFMSPKGGIRPHRRFSVQSKRSEVLFVDYMAEHLTSNGRAGIIVPEGVIFQSQTAHTQLRKMLVEGYLVAVVSLPAGVFQPYSGVKTSILILDRALVRRTNAVAFFKVERDGFDLGAQRRPIEANDLPTVQTELAEYLRCTRAGESLEGYAPTLGLVIERSRIAEGGGYNLSVERYRISNSGTSRFPWVSLGDVAEIIRGITFRKSDQLERPTADSLSVATTKAAQEAGIVEETLYHIPRSLLKDESKLLRTGDILISTANSLRLLGRTTPVQAVKRPTSFGAFMSLLRPKQEIISTYLLHCLRTDFASDFFFRSANTTTNISNLNLNTLATLQIPLPPIEVQQTIVTEIEGYQRVIDGARSVLAGYRPHVAVDPSWPTVELGSVIRTVTPPEKIFARDFDTSGSYPVIDQSQEPIAGWTDEESTLIDVPAGGVVIFGDHTCIVKFVNQKFAQGADGIKIIQSADEIDPRFLYFYLLSYPLHQDGYKRHFGALKRTFIAVPPLDVQQSIVAELDAERTLVEANRELIGRMEARIASAVGRVWGE